MFFTTAIPEEQLSAQLNQEGNVGFLYDERFYPSRRQSPLGRVCGVAKEGYPYLVGIGRACTPPLWVYNDTAGTERKATSEEIEAYRQRSNFVPSYIPWQTNIERTVLNESKTDDNAVWLENEDPKKFPGLQPPMRLLASQQKRIFQCDAKECLAFKGGIKNAWWRADNNEIIFERFDGPSYSMSGLYAWRPASSEIRTIIHTEDLLSNCQGSKSHAICLREQWTHPATIVSIDLDSGEIARIFDPNPAFDEIEFSKIEKLEWIDEFGNPTHGHLVYR